MEKEKEARPIKVACGVCHGQGARETGNGVVDCPNPRCEFGYVTNKEK